ncbi:hypothetical protein QWY85_10735 [Neolewinella lacunae]|uniref:AlgX/AlgJ SGNH hydrolase-like domain-containing protein n=1 Tax=Neolewinella lacunae TaxID=1517758 RepID=A0A923PL62_9BACT|nr:hypothetical protein [Neolewinella lacunae]MBC6996075.1 hypothetical protein [Neolewinella lacunae]MDN3635134.1 hypothetical protein [Neolewinella lacunae]
MSATFRYGLPLVFAAVLVLGWLDAAFFWALTQVQGFENKRAAEVPTVQLDHLDPLPQQTEAYFNDHFPWKGLFQRFNGRLQAVTNGRSPLPDYVVLGTDDWLYKGGLQLDIYRGKRRFSPAELSQVVKTLQARRDSVAARGGHYYLAVAPLKHHIYPAFLPDHVRPLNQEYAVRQLYAALASAGVKTIDLHTPLQAYATAHPPQRLDHGKLEATVHNLYYRTDHHWTVRAGLLAATVIGDALRADGLPLAPLDTSGFRFHSEATAGMTLAKLAGLDRQAQDHFQSLQFNWQTEEVARPDLKVPPGFPYPTSYVRQFQQSDPHLREALPSLFVNRESFGENIMRPLSEQAGSAFFLFDEWKHELNLPDYTREGGTIYLQLIWEGFLFNLLALPEEDGKW